MLTSPLQGRRTVSAAAFTRMISCRALWSQAQEIHAPGKVLENLVAPPFWSRQQRLIHLPQKAFRIFHSLPKGFQLQQQAGPPGLARAIRAACASARTIGCGCAPAGSSFNPEQSMIWPGWRQDVPAGGIRRLDFTNRKCFLEPPKARSSPQDNRKMPRGSRHAI